MSEKTEKELVPEIQEHDIIDLALSGGGFRAALYHLGVIGFLSDKRQLSKVRNICSVSGGSILAAYFLIHWHEITESDTKFQSRAEKFVRWLTTNDISGRVLAGSRLKIFWPWVKPRIEMLEPLDSRLLVKEYAKLLCHSNGDPVRWDELPQDNTKNPSLYITATHLNSGRAGAYSKTGFSFPQWGVNDAPSKRISLLLERAEGTDTTNQAIARAVAASSAFPPLFAPLSVSDDCEGHLLVDGGVYDNTGVLFLQSLHQSNGNDESVLVIASDAGREFQAMELQKSESIVELGMRVVETQGDRIVREDKKNAAAFFKNRGVAFQAVSIHDELVKHDFLPECHTGSVTRSLRRIRTELDMFSLEEAVALYRQGYLTMQQKWGAAVIGPIPWVPTTIGTETDLTHLGRAEMETRLSGGHVVKKWRRLRSQLVTTLCTFLLVVFLAWLASLSAATALRHWWSQRLPANAKPLTEVAELLTFGDRKSFIENAIVKGYFEFPVDVPVRSVTTIFFECEKPGHVKSETSSFDKGSTIKLQIIEPEVSERKNVTVRPRSSGSGTGGVFETWVFCCNQETSLERTVEIAKWKKSEKSGYDEYTVEMEVNGVIVVATAYGESPFAAAASDEPNALDHPGWIHVEVTDFQAISNPDFFFLYGNNRDLAPQIDLYSVLLRDGQPYLAEQTEFVIDGQDEAIENLPRVAREAAIAVIEDLSTHPDFERLIGDTDSVDSLRRYLEVGSLDSRTSSQFVGHVIASPSSDLAYLLKQQLTGEEATEPNHIQETPTNDSGRTR